MKKRTFSRRDFIQLSAGAAALLGLPSCVSRPSGPSGMSRKFQPGDLVRIAQIGCGGMGASDVRKFAGERVVALCDIDWSLPKCKEVAEEFPKARRFTDFRVMLHEMKDEIDAVVVSTPDHMHFLCATMAIALGKHVYVQKPVTQTIGEARELRRIAGEMGVCTQMGNQGHAGEGIRLVREWVQGGMLGTVKEVHVWTNRPIWPQGLQGWPAAEQVPANVNWDLFLGRSEQRPFSSKIHPFNWRGLINYGTGALGDMGCHLLDASFWALDLDAPESVVAESVGLSSVSFPTQAKVTYRFPARGSRAPVSIIWYEGGLRPELFEELKTDSRVFGKGGQFWVGDKAALYDETDYCTSPRIVPDVRMKELRASLPKKTIPRVPKANPYEEWLNAIRQGKPELPGSRFDYSVPMTEMVLLGNLAIQSGKTISWDPVRMTTGHPDVDALLHPSYRQGWSLEETKMKI